jgi:uncharacterized heparinase superfamily protein
LAGFAGLPEAERLIDVGEELLLEAYAGQFFADGGHKSRAPEALLDALCDLVTVDLAYARLGRESPASFAQQMAKMAAMLRLFRLGDGALACFHGGGEGLAGSVDAALREVGAGRDFQYATQSGFHRVSLGETALVMDVGQAPPRDYAERAHAGPLAFELSAGPERLIVNVGSGRSIDANWRAAGRATNGHSTLVVDDALACAFETARGFRAAARPVGPPTISGKRTEDEDGVALEALHDGYRADYGLIHRRALHLRKDGGKVFGLDSLARPMKETKADPQRAEPSPFALRFHVHPLVALEQPDTRTALLATRRGAVWRFRADRDVTLEDSVYLGHTQPQRTRQIVIVGAADPRATGEASANRVMWALTRLS